MGVLFQKQRLSGIEQLASTADGFTVQVSNYDGAFTWAVSTDAGSATISDSGLVTVTGLTPEQSATVTVTTTRTNYTSGSATVTGSASTGSGLTPTFDPPTSMTDGFTVQVSNYDGAFTWAVSADAGSATISDSGLVSVTGLALGQSATVTVTTTRTGYAGGSATATGSASTGSALTPTFETPTPTIDGFTVQVSNYDAAYTWAVSTDAGSATISDSGLVTVTGLTPGQSATVTVTTTRRGYPDGSAQIVGSPDSDGDGQPDNTDPFPNAITQAQSGAVTLTTFPPSAGSSCSIQLLSVDSVGTSYDGVAENGSGVGVTFRLAGCSTVTAETLRVEIDLGTNPAAGSVAYKIDVDGVWTAIAGAAISGSVVTYSITDNDGVLDQDDDLGEIDDPVTVAVPITPSAPAMPVPTLPAALAGLLALLMAGLGWRRLA